MRSRGSQLEVSLSPRLWADAGAPQNGRTKAGDEAWSQGLARDKAQVSLRKLHCASVPRAAAAGQTAGPSVCCLSSIAGSEAKAGAMSEQAGPSGKGQLKETGDPVAWRAPRGGTPAVWGATVGHKLSSGVGARPGVSPGKGGRHDATSPTTS